MKTEHPITPPPELVKRWYNECPEANEASLPFVATQAARWGADTELEACCEWVSAISGKYGPRLRTARRPKPPSLKEQALEMLECIPTHDSGGRPNGIDVSIIRRALEQLDD